jgi:hypothetical protein
VLLLYYWSKTGSPPICLGHVSDQIIDAAKGKQIVMFLDYDGTLSPIVDDPDRAFMSRPVSPSFLASVHHNFIDITFFSLYQLLNFVSFR